MRGTTPHCTPQSSDMSPRYHVVQDDCYWERECDAVLSMRNSVCCDDSDDVSSTTSRQIERNATTTDTDPLNTVNNPSSTLEIQPRDSCPVNINNNIRLDTNKVWPINGNLQNATIVNIPTDHQGDHLGQLSPFDSIYSKLFDDEYPLVTKEPGLHNISKQYLNRLNMVMSLVLVACCVVGMGLFLVYMLSCEGGGP